MLSTLLLHSLNSSGVGLSHMSNRSISFLKDSTKKWICTSPISTRSHSSSLLPKTVGIKGRLGIFNFLMSTTRSLADLYIWRVVKPEQRIAFSFKCSRPSLWTGTTIMSLRLFTSKKFTSASTDGNSPGINLTIIINIINKILCYKKLHL